MGFEVPLKRCGGNEHVARRVAALSFQMLSHGKSKADAEVYRDQILSDYAALSEVLPSSPSWDACRSSWVTLANQKSPVVNFDVKDNSGSKKFHFQCTVVAAQGVLNCERVARHCWEKLHAGASKDAVIEWRNQEYE